MTWTTSKNYIIYAAGKTGLKIFNVVDTKQIYLVNEGKFPSDHYFLDVKVGPSEKYAYCIC